MPFFKAVLFLPTYLSLFVLATVSLGRHYTLFRDAKQKVSSQYKSTINNSDWDSDYHSVYGLIPESWIVTIYHKCILENINIKIKTGSDNNFLLLFMTLNNSTPLSNFLSIDTMYWAKDPSMRNEEKVNYGLLRPFICSLQK